jgi:outer membrane protein assembly factor BamB
MMGTEICTGGDVSSIPRARLLLYAVLGTLLGLALPAVFFVQSQAKDSVQWSDHYARLAAERAAEWKGTPAVNLNTSARWPAYRGLQANGMGDETPLLDTWPEKGPPELYRRPIGAGYAGFVIENGIAYTIEQRGPEEVISAYTLATGNQIWTHAYTALFEERLGGDGPRATPSSDGERLYALGATGVLSALDLASGKPIWTKRILDDRGMKNLTYGMSGAPLVTNGKVVVHTSGMGGPGVVAYQAGTGELLWEGAVRKQGYASVMEVTLLGRSQLMNLAGTELIGLDPETGEDLWRFEWDTWNGLSCAQPLVVSDTQVFVSTGYGKGAALVELSESGGKISATAVWSGMSMKNKFNTSVLLDGVVYGLDEGRIAAIDVATGDRRWKAREFGYGQLIAADGKLIVLSEDGELALVSASATAYEELSSVKALTGKTWNNPALAGGILLVRNETEMVAYDLRRQGSEGK